MTEKRHAKAQGSESPSAPETSTPWSAVWPGLLVTLLGAAGVVALFAMVNANTGFAVWDDRVLEGLFSRRSESVLAIFTVITAVFSSTILPIVVVAIGGIWWGLTGRWREPLLLLGSMGLMLVISKVLKHVVARPRPPSETMAVIGFETSFSFPSGHTIAAATFALVGGYLVWAAHRSAIRAALWAVVSVVLISLVALTRLYLGYHYLTDVMAGVSAAVAVLGVVMMINQLFPELGTGPHGGTGSPQTGRHR